MGCRGLAEFQPPNTCANRSQWESVFTQRNNREAHAVVSGDQCQHVGILIAGWAGDSILRTDGAFDILPSDLYLKDKSKMKAQDQEDRCGKRDMQHACVQTKRGTERHESFLLLGIPLAVGAADEWGWCAAPLHTPMPEMQRITVSAEIYRKACATLQHILTWACSTLIIGPGLSWCLCVNTTYEHPVLEPHFKPYYS